jgi:hypothetical protein
MVGPVSVIAYAIAVMELKQLSMTFSDPIEVETTALQFQRKLTFEPTQMMRPCTKVQLFARTSVPAPYGHLKLARIVSFNYIAVDFGYGESATAKSILRG